MTAMEPQIKSKIVIKHIHATYKSSLTSKNDKCPICRNDVLNSCINCEEHNNKITCDSIMGVCGHVFHLHCINTWLSKSQVCPLDNYAWSFAKKT